MKLKRIVSFVLFFLFFSVSFYAQEISLKYGKVTNDELEMTSYEKDTSAVAVVIYDDGYTSYNWVGDDFQISTEVKKKIKILKQEGTDKATITIPYYLKSNSSREYIKGLEAIAYNLENGQVVKTKLEKKYIFEEELGGNYRLIKFSIPNVKEGTVIEYKYQRLSDFIYDLPDKNMQTDIPVMNSRYEVLIPEYYVFNIETKGYEKIDVKETAKNQQFTIHMRSVGTFRVSSVSRNIVYTATDLPGLENEHHVWCKQDYVTGIRFELKGTNYPRDYYRAFTKDWESLEKTLRESAFGSSIKISNPYKKEIQELLKGVEDDNSKIALTHAFVKSKIKWNEVYSFMGNDTKDAVKNGTGNNAQINVVLISALKDAGIKAYPILISRRSKGRLPYTYPSIDALNTFIVAAQASDGAVYYMDGSATYGNVNMLPTDLLVDRGRVFEPTVAQKWVNLTNISRNRQNCLIQVSLNDEGNLVGELTSSYSGQMAYEYKRTYYQGKDSTSHVEKLAETKKISIDSIFIEGKEPMSNMVKEKIVFSQPVGEGGEYVYINPMIFPHLAVNEFTQTERKLPVEFDYPYTYQQNIVLTVPDNYEIEEIPKSMQIVLDENKGKCTFQIQQAGNTLNVNYRFDLNQVLFPAMDYQHLSEFFGQVVAKNQETIVLKKL
ncbi:MAG: DUF3857 domain-containing protein [Candidatus Azobacteroides sp.]|nr:DUF3857 domain-containing protein [Candidatus Azobacteroides sp.]